MSGMQIDDQARANLLLKEVEYVCQELISLQRANTRQRVAVMAAPLVALPLTLRVLESRTAGGHGLVETSLVGIVTIVPIVILWFEVRYRSNWTRVGQLRNWLHAVESRFELAAAEDTPIGLVSFERSTRRHVPLLHGKLTYLYYSMTAFLATATLAEVLHAPAAYWIAGVVYAVILVYFLLRVALIHPDEPTALDDRLGRSIHEMLFGSRPGRDRATTTDRPADTA